MKEKGRESVGKPQALYERGLSGSPSARLPCSASYKPSGDGPCNSTLITASDASSQADVQDWLHLRADLRFPVYTEYVSLGVIL
jgi:hypothetical protein